MRNMEAIQMMERCVHDLEQQRKEIERLRPKADAYDVIAKILGLIPGPNVGYGVDIIWELRKAIEQETAELMPKQPVEEDNNDDR